MDLSNIFPQGEDKQLHHVLEDLLIKRGIDTQEKARRFLHPSADDLSSPYLFTGVKDAKAEIDEIISQKKKIIIYGDYDCDGIGASAIMYLTLKHLNADVDTFIPTRAEDGYGLSADGLDRVINKFSPGLIITVDCGISSPNEVETAKQAGVKVIVTDHHEPQSKLPDCTVINPKLDNGMTELCGAGVALKLAEALAGKDFALSLVDICAISTIADLVPLTGDNRIITRLGLDMLSKNTRPGIKALLTLAGHKKGARVTSYDVAFKIAPRLNASGRLSTAEKSLKLLIDDDPYLINLISNELEAENKFRQDLCAKTISEAHEMLHNYDLNKNKIIILSRADWEGGVIGIAAAKVSQEFHRPAILFCSKGDVLKGSGRSVAGVNIHDILSHGKDFLIQFGGHSMAAGLSIRPDNLDAFLAASNEYIEETYDISLFSHKFKSDAEVSMKDLSLDFAAALSAFEPFGIDNPKPLFKERVRKTDFERIQAYTHIKNNIKRNVSAVAFNMSEYLDVLNSDMEKTLYFTVEKECFNNKDTVKCYLKSIELNEIAPKGEEFLSYSDKFIVRQPQMKLGMRFAPAKNFGHLIIVFSVYTYERLIKDYPFYKKQYGLLDGVNPENTLLLAPYENAGGYDYFSLIEVYDNPPAPYIDFLKNSFNAEIIVHQNSPKFDYLPKLDVEMLRETYSYMFSYVNGKALPKDAAYIMLKNRNYPYDKVQFMTAYHIFLEMGLIAVENNSIIYIKKTKVDLTQSGIFSLLGSYAGNH